MCRISALEGLLKPISQDIGLDSWWSGVKRVFVKLLETFDGNPDKDWWSRIMDRHKPWGSGANSRFDGWYVADMLGIDPTEPRTPTGWEMFNWQIDRSLRETKKKPEILGKIELKEFPKGFTTVPISITDGYIEEEAAFIGGIAGYKTNLNPDDGSAPYVEPVHGWALLLDPGSIFRWNRNYLGLLFDPDIQRSL